MSPSPRQRRSTGEPGHPVVIAVSMGDPKGIGPDIALMSWRERQRHGLPTFVVYGDADVLAERARTLGLGVPIKSLASPAEAVGIFPDALPVWPVPSPAVGDEDRAIVAAIEAAVAAVCAGQALAIVTNPIVKRTLDRAELPYPGHTEFLAELAVRHGTASRPLPVMMLVAEELKVVPATVH
ncbi:MAG: 4-hydroxythreonine-4-phosphate dehydrogenase PdxA, partial [Hyphomicrobiaceae bacterium]|nr:4-hydroxythreonine-4-phosphate dehydrogenase PdxA [Hyphomicrobiaceae bacterium]